MSMNDKIPVISYASIQTYLNQCQGCGEQREDLEGFMIRVGSNFSTTIVWCPACQEKVVAFLTQGRPGEQREHGTPLERKEEEER